MLLSRAFRTGQRGARTSARQECGFTYFTVLIVVAIMGAGLAAIGTVWEQTLRREKERELLFVGGEFRRAIGTYFESSPGGPQFPKSLDDLVLDKRLPVVRRHLRKVYVDPMTGTHDWGLVKDQAGAIMGVYSKDAGKPIKTAKFSEPDKAFEASLKYSDWRFVYGGGSVAAAATNTPVAGLPNALDSTAGPAAVPLASPTDTTSPREDPAREARRPACEKQRAGDIAACEAVGPPNMQNPSGVSCAASAAESFNACMNGPASAAPSPG